MSEVLKEKLELKVNIPSSFVKSNVKIYGDKGAGEGKLFIGSKKFSEEYDDFFEFNENNYKYCFDKENMLIYMNQVKIEYVYHLLNHYKDCGIEDWNNFFSER